MSRRLRYVAAESDPLYLHALRNRFLRTPNVEVEPLDQAALSGLAGSDGGFDTALCLNVVEYLDEPESTVAELSRLLRPGGKLVLLAPRGEGLYGRVDRAMGHRRRYSADALRSLAERQGLRVVSIRHLNRISTPVWWLHARLLHRRRISKLALKIFDKTVWLWRRLDRLLPWGGLTLVLVAERPRHGADQAACTVNSDVHTLKVP